MNDLALNNLYSTKPLEVRDFLAKLVDQGKLFYKEVIAELLTKILLIELSPQNQKELINLLGQLTGSETAFETLASLCRGPYFEDVLEESYTALSKVDPYKSLEVINSCKKLELVEPEEKLEEKPLSSGLKVQPLTPETASACVQRTAKIEFVSYINGEITAQVSNLAGRDQEVIAVASIADAEGFKRIERQVEIPEEGGIITIPYAVRGLDGMNVDFYLSTGQGIIDALRSEGVNKGLSGREVPR